MAPPSRGGSWYRPGREVPKACHQRCRSTRLQLRCCPVIWPVRGYCLGRILQVVTPRQLFEHMGVVIWATECASELRTESARGSLTWLHLDRRQIRRLQAKVENSIAAESPLSVLIHGTGIRTPIRLLGPALVDLMCELREEKQWMYSLFRLGLGLLGPVLHLSRFQGRRKEGHDTYARLPVGSGTSSSYMSVV